MAVEQSGSFWKFMVKLKDDGTNPLFSGSEILVFCRSMGFDYTATYGEQSIPINAQSYLTGTSEVAGSAGSFWRNNLGRNQFRGINNATVNLEASWTVDVGSYYSDGAGSLPILTPYKAVALSMSGRQLRLLDERIIRQMYYESDGAFYSGSGMPVIIKNVRINTDNSSENLVSFSLTLREDR